jgi:hypothetical protein
MFFLKKDSNKKILTLQIGRVGSSVIGDLLNQHPDIYWDGELLSKTKKKMDKNVKSYKKLQKVFESTLKSRIRLAGRRWYGFEIKFLPEQQMIFTGYDLKNFLAFVKKIGFEYFIIIERQNYLQRNISHILFERKRKEGIGYSEKIEFPIENLKIGNETRDLLDWFDYFEKKYEYLNSLLEEFKHIKIIYEKDIINNPMIGYQKILEFLGADKYNVVIKRKKSNTKEPKRIISNYEEVKKELINTKYYWMLKGDL